MPRKARVTRKKTTATDDAFEVQLDRRSDAGPEVPTESESNSAAPAEAGSIDPVAPAEAGPLDPVAPAKAESNSVMPTVANSDANSDAMPGQTSEPELQDGQIHVIMGLINALQDRVRVLELASESKPREQAVFTEEHRRLLDKLKSKPIATMNVETLKRLLTVCN
tara:strand:+ start:293 stop:790 length:498 start_codon:yes stop_codon:yes gene_type:complete